MTNRSIKTLLVASAASGAILAGAAGASAQGVSEQLINEINAMDRAQKAATATALRNALNVPGKGPAAVSLELSGQINRALLYTNDGKRDGVQSVDNQNSGTRFRLVGTARLNEDVSARAYWEAEQMTIPGSAAGNVSAKSFTANTPAFSMRHADVQFISATLGSVELGHGSNAADGHMWPDLSGTGVIALPSAVRLLGGGAIFRSKSAMDSESKNLPSGPTVNTAFNQPVPTSRSNRVAYRTPMLAGILQGAASFTNGDGYQAGLRATSSVGMVRFDARAFYEKLPTAGSGHVQTGVSTDGPTGQNIHTSAYGGAASVLFDFGLSLMGSYSELRNRTSGRSNRNGWYAKVGYQADWTPMGRTALAVDFQQVKHAAQNDDRGRAWGVMAVQNVNALSAEIFALYRQWQLKRGAPTAAQIAADNTNFRDIHQVAIGSRIRF